MPSKSLTEQSKTGAATQHRTPTQLLADIALAQATRTRPDPWCDVELTWNAKGDTQLKVAYSHPDPAHAAQVASELYDVIRAKYQRTNGA